MCCDTCTRSWAVYYYKARVAVRYSTLMGRDRFTAVVCRFRDRGLLRKVFLRVRK
jgi:hypothetical protein